MSRRASTLKTTSYYTDNTGDLALCRSGDLWTVGVCWLVHPDGACDR